MDGGWGVKISGRDSSYGFQRFALMFPLIRKTRRPRLQFRFSQLVQAVEDWDDFGFSFESEATLPQSEYGSS